MPRRVAEDTEVFLARRVGHPRGAQFEHIGFGPVDVVDLDVEVELLGAVRIRERGRLMVGGELEGEPAPRRIIEGHPRLVVGLDVPAQHLGPEFSEPSRVGAVHDDGVQFSDHPHQIAGSAAAETSAVCDRFEVRGVTAVGVPVKSVRPAADAVWNWEA